MPRTTRTELNGATQRLIDALNAVGIPCPAAHHYELVIGSQTYGVAYRFALVEDATGAHRRTPIGDDYLGMTASAAADTLRDRARVLEDVAYHLHTVRNA